MALIWADGFEHYGTGPTAIANMKAGSWSDVGSYNTIETTIVRTGSYAIRTGMNVLSASILRRVLPGGPRQTVGTGFGMYMVSSSNGNMGIQFLNSSGPILTATIEADGSVIFHRGTFQGAVIGLTDSGLITPGVFQHIEIAVHFNPVVGWIEMRIEGVTVFRVEEANTGTGGATIIQYGNVSISFYSGVQTIFDDVFAWDDSGDTNNTFIGPARVLTYVVEGDDDATMSVHGADTPSEAVSEIPQDGDTSYIRADEVGKYASFTLPALPPEVVAMPGIFVQNMSRIEEAGLGRIRLSLINENEEIEEGEELALTPSYAYRGSVFETNPSTGEMWTKEELEQSILKIEKTL